MAVNDGGKSVAAHWKRKEAVRKISPFGRNDNSQRFVIPNEQIREAVSSSESVFAALRRTALDKIVEERRHLAGFFVPFFSRAEGFVVVLGKQNVNFAFL
jgi:hypothetical protein